jgi:hypothetical protein
MQKLTPPQINWLLQHQPNIDHWIDDVFYDKLVQSDIGKEIYIDPVDYADLPLEFHELAKRTSIEQPKNKHNLLLLFANRHWYLLFAAICFILGLLSPYWSQFYGDWYAFITLTFAAGWLLCSWYEN